MTTTPTTTHKITPLTLHRDESVAREKTKTKCWDVMFEKWSNIRKDCHLHWNGPDPNESLFEKTVMREHIEIFEYGAVMTFVVFGALRLTAHPQFLPVVERYIKPLFRLTPPALPKVKPKQSVNEGITLKKKTNQANIKEPHSAHVSGGRQFKSYLEKQRDGHVVRVNKAAEAPHDFMVATLVGLSATCFFMRPAQLRLDFEEAPLAPGRSFSSEQMCDDFIKIYQETDPKVFASNGLETPDANLKTFETFALNCVLRSAHVNKRKEAGEEKPLVLPTNGPWEEEDGAIIL